MNVGLKRNPLWLGTSSLFLIFRNLLGPLFFQLTPWKTLGVWKTDFETQHRSNNDFLFHNIYKYQQIVFTGQYHACQSSLNPIILSCTLGRQCFSLSSHALLCLASTRRATSTVFYSQKSSTNESKRETELSFWKKSGASVPLTTFATKNVDPVRLTEGLGLDSLSICLLTKDIWAENFLLAQFCNANYLHIGFTFCVY